VRIGGERELRDEEQFALDIAQRQVHFAVRVAEHAVAEQTLEQSIGLTLPVSSLDSHEGQQSSADLGDARAVHDDIRPAHAL
jgi:hypothetical protein